MKVLFINPSYGFSTRTISNPMGLISLASYLNSKGHTAIIYDRNCDKGKLSQVVGSFEPDVVGVSVLSLLSLKDAQKITSFLKEAGQLVVWGGQIPTFYTGVCAKCSRADYLILGEGELTWLELLEKLELQKPPDGIAGLAYWRNGELTVTDEREFVNLDTLPAIDWSVVNPQNYFQSYITADRMLMLPASKGCPCNCAFCGNQLYHRRTLRKGNIKTTVDEIEILVNKYNTDGIYFTDELWYPDKRDVHEFCELISSRKINVKWGLQARIGQFDSATLREMRAAGCSWIFYGVESGSRDMLEKIHKQIKYDDIEPSIRITNEAGIITMTSFIVGFPDETEQEVKDTIALAKSCGSNIISFNLYFLTPGSDLYIKLISENRLHEPQDFSQIYNNFSTKRRSYKNFSNISTRDLKVIQSYFHWSYFTGKSSAGSRLNKVATHTIRNTLKSIFSGFGHRSLSLAIGAANEFISVVWFTFAYPKTRKKYGLDKP